MFICIYRIVTAQLNGLLSHVVVAQLEHHYNCIWSRSLLRQHNIDVSQIHHLNKVFFL